MPWDGSPLAGFTTGKPWLPLGADHAVVNVAALEQQKDSILHLYRKLIALRRKHPALVNGKMQAVAAVKSLLRFERCGSGEQMLILLNMGHAQIQAVTGRGFIIASTHSQREDEELDGVVDLSASEGLIVKLAP